MDWLLHLLGICPDSASHPSILAFLGLFSGYGGLKFFSRKKKEKEPLTKVS